MARSLSSRKGSERCSPARSSTRTARAGAKRGAGFLSSPWLSGSADAAIGCGHSTTISHSLPGSRIAKTGFFHAIWVNTGSTVYGGGGSGEPTTRDAVQRGRGDSTAFSFSPSAWPADWKMAKRATRTPSRMNQWRGQHVIGTPIHCWMT